MYLRFSVFFDIFATAVFKQIGYASENFLTFVVNEEKTYF
jgi:hypothetical protein